MSQSRQLAAIMFTDIVGYTALMNNDEHIAFAYLKKNRDLHQPIIAAYQGRWIKELGDGVMASFNTVSDAVNAAVKIQEACTADNAYQLRIGIHLGEVVFENDDVFGDGVNIAARIQSACAPGCIFISESVHRNISNKKDAQSQFVKEVKLKNVKESVRLYQVLFEGSETIASESPEAPIVENSIAVLPFANMSNDPDQEFFSDGITEEIINVLAQVPRLKVIGRTSSFAFKGKNMDLKVIGEQLKVSYLLEGSVRKGGNKLRITAQLIKVADGFHLYSEKFDRELIDVFAIQDEISEAILKAIKIKLLKEERDEVSKNYTDNVEAYQHYLKGRFHFNKYEWPQAIECYKKAIATDPSYAIAYAHASICYHDMAFFNMDADENIKLAIAASNQALTLDDQSSECHFAKGRINLWHDWDFTMAEKHLNKAIQLNPNNGEAMVQYGRLLIKLGDYNVGYKYLQQADKLDPFSLIGLFYICTGYFDAHDITKLSEYSARLIALAPNFIAGHIIAGYASLYTQREEEALASLELAVKLNGDISTLSHLAFACALVNKTERSREVLKEMSNLAAGQNIASYNFGFVHAGLGEWDKAIEYFDEAINRREGYMLEFVRHLQVDFPEMKADPRIISLMDRIGLPY